MSTNNEFRKNLTAQEVEQIIMKVLQEIGRPANETILKEKELLDLLGISKRTLATWRTKKIIPYHPIGNIFFYILSDVLETLNQHRNIPLSSKLRIPISKRK